ncbi:hypothetical protein VIN01S_22050 [Vibrio inusitatus NBRC 102082]|uniref:Uncharacterized protein n=1 Tax=Vibrio inusitatus NBRC 102082 TaxID=1219070 RepID=A0A4Y3HWQ4_9VIBR|nr:hypothetical protein [Vibrio inusitatus]GEA51401.1 hypothetical protein VIN01S_22050 [Vibrio inusitatus NBRC 102082]
MFKRIAKEKTKIVIVSLLINISSSYAKENNFYHLSDSVPENHKISKVILGDLTNDGRDEHILLIKGTLKEKLIKNGSGKVVDRNRRGMIVLTDELGSYSVLTSNLDCFESENEDGGFYFPPEMEINIKGGNLYVKYFHGRYGSWEYNFRYNKNDLELIGFENTEYRNAILSLNQSVNFITKKMQTLRLDESQFDIFDYNEKPTDDMYLEKWEKLSADNMIRFSEISSLTSRVDVLNAINK